MLSFMALHSSLIIEERRELSYKSFPKPVIPEMDLY
jgi:hypothetical protein